MNYLKTGWVLLLIMTAAACGRKKGQPRQQEIVQNIRQLDEVVPEQVRERLEYVAGNEGVMEDSVPAFRLAALQYAYSEGKGAALWSKNGQAAQVTDSMMQWINAAGNYGLNPAHYHARALNDVQNHFRAGKDAQKDAALWAKMDVLLTDAFFKMSYHLHYGVAPRDSVTLRKDSLLSDTVLANLLQTALQNGNISAVLQQQEPFHPGYVALKEGVQQFSLQFGGMHWDTLPQQYYDTLLFKQQLAARLIQTGQLDSTGFTVTDSVKLKNAVRKFQKEFNIYPDGVAGKRTIQLLNKQPQDWLLQAALNLDRWRKLPDTLPGRYLLVNIPAFRLNVMEDTASVVESRVIVGTPRTRTPILNSVMTNFVLYPYWRVPYSIVFKEMLPQIKKNVGYLAEKNLEVVDRHGNVVSPDSVNWSKLGRNHFPYVLRQMDGLDNSLGILKFNFANKFSVYLHDTNNRSLFSNSNRALSHGCVRVQAWDSLAMYMIRNDPRPEMRDSVRAWLDNEEQRVYSMTNRLPIYIRYFTAEMREGRLQFYEDVYGEDKTLEKYFK
ncbi:murein L,D-transpeptidase [Chitinophaga sp. GCM10012297]|uniref:L,D-transpeptidase family protein n=1 Tax=Chitinophaga chungangae TaxID=2821488 RepID=A0ABS3YK61_9BACT|nr:L,D-transpeptidase family protein [Chitinophaga chungangae]MBO9155075.1 L,D-transpeptidase family protein [Chitinophaga chungangae]